ncbi:hypothetical protein skT53_00160 [Effusibacillus dendaii]|uniref:Uncharacterized protein n=1 Tax=Effusibacillus dendaii TaxID=2743772 RepID=A0A7I8DAV0_9BACL|nr:hypothetical protein skT53_00160 [Effusibacillus dendaii]
MEEKYCQLFHNSNDALYLYELTEYGVPSPFTEINNVALIRMGYSKEEFNTISILELTSPEFTDELLRMLV